MLTRTEHDRGLVTYQSPLLRAAGVIHAFSTRLGGISPPPYDSLNLGVLEKNPRTDGNTHIAENFRRLRRAIGADRMMRVEVRQVHGADVWSPPQEPMRAPDAPCADAIVTDRRAKLLTIRTADCVPVLLTDRQATVIAAVHAGWRGVVAGVVPTTLHRLYRKHNLPPQDLFAAIGPCIGVDHFEVGADVGIAFAQAGLEQVVRRGADDTGRTHINLREAVLQQLVHEGVPTAQIDQTDRCTYQHDHEFFSHRRDVTHHQKPGTGRMAAVIALPQGEAA